MLPNIQKEKKRQRTSNLTVGHSFLLMGHLTQCLQPPIKHFVRTDPMVKMILIFNIMGPPVVQPCLLLVGLLTWH